MTQAEYFGNTALLERRKVAFFCSRTVSGATFLRCYDWATEIARQADTVVIGGFQSKVEKDVLHFLLKSGASVIIVLARRMYKQIPEELQQPFTQGRILFISTAPRATRTGATAAEQRNHYIATIADHITFGYLSDTSSLNKLATQFPTKSQILTVSPS